MYYKIRFTQDCLSEAIILKFFLELEKEKVQLINVPRENVRQVIQSESEQSESEQEMTEQEINMVFNDGLRNLTEKIIKFQNHRYSKPFLEGPDPKEGGDEPHEYGDEV